MDWLILVLLLWTINNDNGGGASVFLSNHQHILSQASRMHTENNLDGNGATFCLLLFSHNELYLQ
jgi:hypothetical protein